MYVLLRDACINQLKKLMTIVNHPEWEITFFETGGSMRKKALSVISDDAFLIYASRNKKGIAVYCHHTSSYPNRIMNPFH